MISTKIQKIIFVLVRKIILFQVLFESINPLNIKKK